jgi:hypothetical protein
MSTHPVTAPVEKLRALCELALPGRIVNVTGDPVTGAIQFVAVPDLTPAEVITLANLHAAAAGAVEITPAEWAILAPLIASGKVFMAIPAPTNAQNAAAIKGVLRVLNIIFRDAG